MKMHSVIGLIGGAALLTAAPVALHRSQNTVALSLDSAVSRIGRPRTALSVAGVQRRGYRRAYRGAVYGAIAGYGTGSYYSGYSSPAYSAPSSYGYSGYGYPSYSAPYYGSGYGPYYGGYGSSTAPLYKPVTFRLPGWRYQERLDDLLFSPFGDRSAVCCGAKVTIGLKVCSGRERC